MKLRIGFVALGLVCVASSVFSSVAKGADEPTDEFVQMVVNLLGEKDKDLRAVGLEQVRTAAKGAATTKQFSSRLAKLPTAAQEGLLGALADRGDSAARPDILALLQSTKEETVRLAAIRAIGVLGDPADLKLLVEAAGGKSAAERDAAATSLTKLKGDSVNKSLADELKTASPESQIRFLGALVTRRATDSIAEIAPLSVGSDAKVRAAAMDAMSQLASAGDVSKMIPGVLKAELGPERDAAEKFVYLACRRITDPTKQSEAVLSYYESLGKRDEQLALLSTVGRVGGTKSLAIVEAAIASTNPAEHQAGLHAICMWPDATVADRLLELTKAANNPADRWMTFKSYVRVGTVRGDKRTDAQRFERVKQAMEVAKTTEEKTWVLQRSRFAYLVDTMRFLLPYSSQPEFAQMACESIVELAHHREVREPNKPEFDKALDMVMKTSKDPVIVDRANKYKNGQTWLRPKFVDGP